jgi:hypothetical protein
MRADEAIEDPAYGERQKLGVFVDNAPDESEQRLCLLMRIPVDEAARASGYRAAPRFGPSGCLVRFMTAANALRVIGASAGRVPAQVSRSERRRDRSV